MTFLAPQGRLAHLRTAFLGARHLCLLYQLAVTIGILQSLFYSLSPQRGEGWGEEGEPSLSTDYFRQMVLNGRFEAVQRVAVDF
jgi:hypothetical protein